jgi:hypothetical protein
MKVVPLVNTAATGMVAKNSLRDATGLSRGALTLAAKAESYCFQNETISETIGDSNKTDDIDAVRRS